MDENHGKCVVCDRDGVPSCRSMGAAPEPTDEVFDACVVCGGPNGRTVEFCGKACRTALRRHIAAGKTCGFGSPDAKARFAQVRDLRRARRGGAVASV